MYDIRHKKACNKYMTTLYLQASLHKTQVWVCLIIKRQWKGHQGLRQYGRVLSVVMYLTVMPKLRWDLKSVCAAFAAMSGQRTKQDCPSAQLQSEMCLVRLFSLSKHLSSILSMLRLEGYRNWCGVVTFCQFSSCGGQTYICTDAEILGINNVEETVLVIMHFDTC